MVGGGGGGGGGTQSWTGLGHTSVLTAYKMLQIHRLENSGGMETQSAERSTKSAKRWRLAGLLVAFIVVMVVTVIALYFQI